MAYGVTDAGFIVKRLQEIKTEIETAIREAFGDVDLTPDSVFGQLVGVFAKPAADVWEVLQDVYDGHYPNSAYGAGLDSVVGLNGITRREATRTRVEAILNGTDTTVIPAGSQASTDNEAIIFVLESDVTLDKANVLKAKIKVATLTVGSTYRVTINATNYDHVATGGDTKATIAATLAASISAGAHPVTAVDDGVDSMVITADDAETIFSIDVGSIKLTLEEQWTPAVFNALDAGEYEALLGHLTVIETPVAGWAGVNNLLDGITGLPVESDTEFRLRRLQSLTVIGAGTVEAIRARLLTLEGATAVYVIENRTDVTDGDGRPPHSFEAVVDGTASDEDIGEMLWAVKPAGINTYSTNSPQNYYDVEDSAGDTQRMYFSRPNQRYVHVEVTVTSFYSEEDLPADWKAQMKEAIAAYGDALPIGKDLIIQRWNVPIFSIAGIGAVTIRQAVTVLPGDSPSWVTTDYPIGATSIANMDVDRITILP